MPSPRQTDSPYPADRRNSIVVVDDDVQIRTLLSRYLTSEGFSVETCGSAEAFWPVFEACAPRIVILDLNLPGQDGFEVARRLRERSGVGIIMLTNKGDMVDRVVGLEVGADDYVPKPFELRELLARLRSVLRRLPAGPDQPAAGSR
jgi:DNA-binding response OmpR family regulator